MRLAEVAVGVLLVAGTAEAQNMPPVCDAGGPYYGLEGEPLQFDGTGSFDPDGQIVSYAWTFGDGSNASGPQPIHTYASGGLYNVRLLVTDNGGLRSLCSPVTNIEAEVPDLPRTQTLADYLNQVDQVLPPLDPRMLEATPGPDWFGGMSVDLVAGAVGDVPPNTVLFDGDMWIAFDDPESTSTRFVRLDFSRDYLRYISRTREFQWEFPHQAVTETQALGVLWGVVGRLGLPGQEMGGPQVDTVVGADFDTGSGQETMLEVERLVTLSRQVMDYPVIGSMARVAVSNRGEPARVLIKWRRFELARDLRPRNRDEVVEEIAERIWEAQQGTTVEMNIALGYGWTPPGFVPVAKVGATDLDGVMEGGMLELVPIAAATTAVAPEAAGPSAPRLVLRVRFSTATGTAAVEFALPAAQQASLAVYSATGRQVRELAARQFAAGRHEIVWDGRDGSSRPVASGTYFVRLDAEAGELVQKILVVR